jgi:diguanylate cyclase (GGDEF)-like protein
MKLFNPLPDTPVILTVDDDMATRKMIGRNLRSEGYKIVEATNGNQCLELYTQVQPDIVLLDAIMPGMDGFECCQKLQELIASPFVSPVLMITGLDDETSVDRAFDAGAADFVTKPIHWPVLLQRVKRLIHQSHLYQELEAANEELARLAMEDSLTGIANRRRMDEYLEEEWRKSIQKRSTLSAILCDVDFFKSYNDTYGHLAGDFCLQQVTEAIKESLGQRSHLLARYGGEEFVVILPEVDSNNGLEIAEEIRKTINDLEIPHKMSAIAHHVTLSLGVAVVVAQQKYSPLRLLAKADYALYQAKTTGRNQSVLTTFTFDL